MKKETPSPGAGQAPFPPSKSQLKREMLDLQKLGIKLAGIPPQRRDALPLNDELRRALDELQRIKAHGARRRLVRRVGKLLNGEDSQLIGRLVASMEQGSRDEIERLHRVERWRERLLQGGSQELTRFLAQHRDADPQRIRQLIRGAHKEQAVGRPPAASRKLFRYLRELLSFSDGTSV